MGVDSNRREGAKPPSLTSRLDDVEREFVILYQLLRQFGDVLENEDLLPAQRRAKVLALLAILSDTGRGARAQS